MHATLPLLEATDFPAIRRRKTETLQVNLGYKCNQSCLHCHVNAGPTRTELMARETVFEVVAFLKAAAVRTLDLTGGAPELNPHFRWFVGEVRRRERHVIDRCNLTILTTPGHSDLAEFLAANDVEVIASLPCYLEENCDRQRGEGVFQRSLAALRMLNAAGYARPGGRLSLHLVYNPVGPALPPEQTRLEAAYREQLRSRFGIEFNRLYTITNMPISRFLDDLLRSDRYEEYMQRLVAAFNPQAVAALMCRSTLSVDWRGRLYDCDFNQMLDLPLATGQPRHIREADPRKLGGRCVTTARHCYGCTAGAGSSCTGALSTGAGR